MILPLRPHHFSAYFSLIFRVLFRTFLGEHFWRPKRRPILQNLIVGAISDFQGSQKWPSGRPLLSQKGSKGRVLFPGVATFRDPAFHETTVILMPLRPSVFKNLIFSMVIGYFSVFSAFRCAMFYMSFVLHLLKNLGKRLAVGPSDFWENRIRFQKQRFSYFGSLRLRFLYIFIFLLIFGCPFPPPGPDWSHLWSISVPCLFGFGRSWRTKQP